MQYPDALSLVSKEFDQCRLPFVLIGGFAVNSYQVTRATADIDFLIAREDYQKAWEVLQKFGYKEGVVQDNFARLRSNQTYLLDIDLVFVDRDTLDGVLETAREVDYGGNKFLVPRLEHLIAMKLHSLRNNFEGRQQPDLDDVVHLIRKNNVDTSSHEFRELCDTYGPNGIYETVQQRLAKKPS